MPSSRARPLERRAIDRQPHAQRTTIHLGESPEEVLFLEHGEGPWRDLLQRRGVWPADWTPPGCGPVEYLADR